MLLVHNCAEPATKNIHLFSASCLLLSVQVYAGSGFCWNAVKKNAAANPEAAEGHDEYHDASEKDC